MYELSAKKIATSCALILIFLSQFVPTAYVPIKAALLMLCGVVLGKLLLNKLVVFSREQLIGIGVLSGVALAYSVYGVVRGNPGSVRVLTVMFAWPILYLFISTLLQQPYAIKYFVRFLIITLVAVVIYGWMYLGNTIGVWPDYLYVDLDQGQNVGIYEGYVEYNLYSISSLLFLVPFYIHWLAEKSKRNAKNSRLLNFFLLLASLLLAVLTGRRAMILILILLPLVICFSKFTICNKFNIKIKTKPTILFFGFGIAIGFLGEFLGLDFRVVWDVFQEGFEFSSSGSSASERTLQFHALINGWLNFNIFFGTGNGAAAAISRSDEFPWAYELTYVYLLFSTGIVGVIFYFGWYGWSIFMLRQAMKNRPDLSIYVAPLLTGSISLCIAAATNPYMGKFDYLWIVLLPFFLAGAIRFQAIEK